MFYGRTKELQQLQRLQQKNSASLVCILGRRRIGKSSLIEEFGKGFKNFCQIQGLAPTPNISLTEQLEHFSDAVSTQFNTKKNVYESWTHAFNDLAAKTNKGKHLILLDEISWMSKGDNLFASRLKDAWDLKFKKNPHLILVVCGSVSSWIGENILNHTNFVGRISLQIHLKELDLFSINRFWDANKYKMSSLEKMLVLSVTGGVPKYLEEVLATETVNQNLINLCFTPSGILFNDFDKIFTDIFGRKHKTLEKIVKTILIHHLSPLEVAKKLGVEQNSDLTENLNMLELSGLISRDFYYKPDGSQSKFSRLRIRDNYLRFYLKNIAPIRNAILRTDKAYKNLTDIPGFLSILGLQFENLMLSNKDIIHTHLGLDDSQIISSAPYLQTKTNANRGGCQIDLLIHSNLNTFFLVEFKCQKIIDKKIIKEVQKKEETISIPRRSSIRSVLVYEGELYPPHEEEIKNYFYKTISLQELLSQ